MKDIKSKRHHWGLVIGVTLIGILYGWFVYAADDSALIKADVGSVAAEVAASNGGKLPLDPLAIQLESQTAITNEQQQNHGITAALYSLGPLAADPSATRSANIVTNHLSNYCIKGVEGDSCPDDVLLQLGDTKISTILSGTSYDATRMGAVTQYLYNLIPIPSKNLAPFLNNGKADVSQLGLTALPKDNPNSQAYPNPQQAYADNLSDQALLSISRQPFAEMIAKRTPPSGGGDSTMKMMERIAMQRFMSTEWAANLNPPPNPALPPPNAAALAARTNTILQEMALMQAYHVWLEYERYRQMERIEALLSAVVVQNYKGAQAATAQIANQSTAPVAPAPASSSR